MQNSEDFLSKGKKNEYKRKRKCELRVITVEDEHLKDRRRSTLSNRVEMLRRLKTSGFGK